MDSPFDILGVDPDADEAELVDAYRRRVLETHPDHGGSVSEFQAVQAAYARIKSGDVDAVAGAAAPVEDDASDETAESGSRVEYLNYEVLDDHGWTLDDEDLFEKASDADLDPSDYGRLLVEPDETLLEAAENRGFAWPYACRGGACANCAVAMKTGDLSMPVNTVLPPEMVDRGIRLSCNGKPLADDLRVVYNLKHLPDLYDLRLPPGPFKRTRAGD